MDVQSILNDMMWSDDLRVKLMQRLYRYTNFTSSHLKNPNAAVGFGFLLFALEFNPAHVVADTVNALENVSDRLLNGVLLFTNTTHMQIGIHLTTYNIFQNQHTTDNNIRKWDDQLDDAVNFSIELASSHEKKHYAKYRIVYKRYQEKISEIIDLTTSPKSPTTKRRKIVEEENADSTKKKFITIDDRLLQTFFDTVNVNQNLILSPVLPNAGAARQPDYYSYPQEQPQHTMSYMSNNWMNNNTAITPFSKYYPTDSHLSQHSPSMNPYRSEMNYNSEINPYSQMMPPRCQTPPIQQSSTFNSSIQPNMNRNLQNQTTMSSYPSQNQTILPNSIEFVSNGMGTQYKPLSFSIEQQLNLKPARPQTPTLQNDSVYSIYSKEPILNDNSRTQISPNSSQLSTQIQSNPPSPTNSVYNSYLNQLNPETHTNTYPMDYT